MKKILYGYIATSLRPIVSHGRGKWSGLRGAGQRVDIMFRSIKLD